MLEESGYSSKSLLFTSMSHFVNDGTYFLVSLIAAVLSGVNGVSPLVLTLMFVAFYSTSSILSLYVGNVADRNGKPGTMIAVGTALLSIGLLSFFFALEYTSGEYLSLLVVLSGGIIGFGSAFYHPLAATVLRSAYRTAFKGRALGLDGAMGSLGRALYPSLFFVAAVFFTQVGSIAFFGLFGLGVALAAWLGLRTGSLGVSTSQHTSRARFRSVLNRGIITISVVAFARSVASQGVAAWIPIYLSTQKGLPLSYELGITLSIMYAGGTLSQPLFGYLMDRLDGRVVLGLGTAATALCVLGYTYAEGWMAIVLLALFGAFTFSSFPVLLGLVSDFAPRESISLANSAVWGLGRAGGSILGPAITGVLVLADYSNLSFAFRVMVVIGLTAALMSAMIPKSTKVKG